MHGVDGDLARAFDLDYGFDCAAAGQIAADVEAVRYRAATPSAAAKTARRAECPVFAIFESLTDRFRIAAAPATAARGVGAFGRRSAAARTARASASAAGGRSGRHQRRLAILGDNLARHHLDGHEIRLQRTVRAGGAAARL